MAWAIAAGGCTDPAGSVTSDTDATATDTETPPSSSTGPGVDGSGTTTSPPPATGSSSGTIDDEDESGPPPIKLDVSGMPDAADGHCPVISVQSEPMAVPSDIIIAVDTSGSMNEEAQAVQDNLNMFSQQIVDAGVDARVVLIAEAPGAFSGICIDPPLGGGGCPASDDNEPLFLHVDQYVGSVDAYDRILSTYPSYQGVLRPFAVKQLLIVTDDNAWMTPAQFDAQFLALDVSHFGYTQHGIVSMFNCPQAAQVGQAYMDLAMTTGGTIGDLCLQDFQPVFDELASAVIDNAVPCIYALPETGGGPYDASTAAVEVDFGEGPESIPAVDSPDQCSPDQDNWFFDDPENPTSIIFCPSTCVRLKQSSEAAVEIGVTCSAG
ncbi:MAG: hypothetical protein KDK70_04255 [Myxococcales bacterium]|nr:hypothetical protein [Myxococcales bacterium]